MSDTGLPQPAPASPAPGPFSEPAAAPLPATPAPASPAPATPAPAAEPGPVASATTPPPGTPGPAATPPPGTPGTPGTSGPAAAPLSGAPVPAAAPLPGAVGPAAEPVPEEEPRQRLHPLSPLLKGAKSIAVIIAALSWQTLSSVGLTEFALIVLGLAVAVVVFSAVGWWNTGYHVVGRELRIAEGLVWRRNRAIPLDRLQAVELRRPLLAQLTGLAELRLEVVGGGKTEAPLAYLTVQNTSVLRERLLALSGRTAAIVSAPGTAQTPGGPPGEPPPLFRVRNQDLLISQLLTPQAFLLPLGVAWVITQFAIEGSWTFIGIGGTVTAMAGVLLQPIRKVLRDWDFRLIHGERLILHYGLTETRSQVVPPHRVQAVRITWPFLWRAKGWLHLNIDVAGLSTPEPGDDNSSDRLMPVGDQATARALVAAALPGVDLAAMATSPPPPRAWWLHPFGLRFYGAGLAADVFVSRGGRVTREMTLVPYARLQSVRVVQGPLQRRLGLATVYADTAGGRAGEARDRDLAEAYAIADQLALRSREARATLARHSVADGPRSGHVGAGQHGRIPDGHAPATAWHAPGPHPAGTGSPSPYPAGTGSPGSHPVGTGSPGPHPVGTGSPSPHAVGTGSPGFTPVTPDEPVDDTYWRRPGQT
ncbi:putative membrane protein [Actinoplanes couchii]|uniref:YdbS-like PH domain-containing protein n=1 Tax=Actinoplanes couchii TaxID=403638 RepID=A0ABQ3X2D8_9ACTN|nr:putative membrane protein [Actinoplanes couchii]GID52689.1 hypothetical protein Aco03nite_010930 [Actinoplanes couchii]